MPQPTQPIAITPSSIETIESQLREERLKKVQWMRAWIAYSEMHKDERLRLRSNLSRRVPHSLKAQHEVLLDAHSKMKDKLSPNRKAVLTNMGRNLVRRTASPRVTAAALGDYARFDTIKLVRTCPFFKDPLPDLIETPYDWHSQPDDTPSLWAYEKMSIHLTKGEIIKPADWYSGDEPYALSITTYYRAPEDKPDEGIPFEHFETLHKIHDASPSSGLGAGDVFTLSDSVLVEDLDLREGLAAWSTAISLYEADAPDRQAMNEALDSAQAACQDIATVAGAATQIPPSVPYIQLLAAGVQKAAQISSAFIDFVQTVLSMFEESDDFLGTWGISETTAYLFTGGCPPQETQQRMGTVSGTGAMYRAFIDVALAGCIRVWDPPDFGPWPIGRTAFEQIDIGKNSLGMPDFGNYSGFQQIVHFFPDNSPTEDIESAVAWVSDIEAGAAMIVGCGVAVAPDVPYMCFQPVTKRVKANETVVLEIPHPTVPGGKIGYPFTAAQEGLVAGMTINQWYRGLANIPTGSGHVRYKWNMKARGKGWLER